MIVGDKKQTKRLYVDSKSMQDFLRNDSDSNRSGDEDDSVTHVSKGKKMLSNNTTSKKGERFNTRMETISILIIHS